MGVTMKPINVTTKPVSVTRTLKDGQKVSALWPGKVLWACYRTNQSVLTLNLTVQSVLTLNLTVQPVLTLNLTDQSVLTLTRTNQ